MTEETKWKHELLVTMKHEFECYFILFTKTNINLTVLLWKNDWGEFWTLDSTGNKENMISLFPTGK